MLKDRVEYFEYLFDMLQDTNSLNEKKDIIADIPNDYKADFDYIIYCLSNQVKFGYTYYYDYINDGTRFNEEWTIKDCLEYLQKPAREGNLTYKNIALIVGASYNYKDFFGPIVNKTLKLGIGNSLLPKLDYSAMLAKKYEGPNKILDGTLYVTEKLDGNRCIAHYEDGKWVFTSRNGKIMHVDFDMTGLPTHLVYDGEVLSPKQVKQSEEIKRFIDTGFCDNLGFEDMFNSTSGLINQHTTNKELIFNIFDIQEKNVKYDYRREYLDSFREIKLSKDIRIVPTLAKYDGIEQLNENIIPLLDTVTSLGGEGLMINLGNRTYEHKRTDSLLKLKKVQTIDMRVRSTSLGTGKYEGLVGALECLINTNDGKIISCSVGSGLSDEQRVEWTLHPEKIINHIVEISYFSLSQNESEKGSNLYSLRFPRLKKVRTDKTQTSED